MEEYYDYLEHLKNLIESEREEERRKAIEEIKSLSAAQREKSGKTITGLKGKVVSKNPKKTVIRFGRRVEIKTDIGPGDVVLVSNGDPLKKASEGVVIERGGRYVDVEFLKIPDIRLDSVRVDLFYDDTTFNRMEENLDRLFYGGMKAIKLIFGDDDVSEAETVDFRPFDNKLNPSQKAAISKALGSEDFFIIHGPFGTGKTRTLAEYILQEVERGNRVLATAESNTAVDNLVERLAGNAKIVRVGHPSRIGEKLRKVSLEEKKKEHEWYRELEDIWKEIEELMKRREMEIQPTPRFRRGMSDREIMELAQKRVRAYRGVSGAAIRSMARWLEINERLKELFSEAEKIEKRIEKDIFEKMQVVLTTNSTAFTVDAGFDVAVIDEATQSIIPSTLIPINKARKFILAGDHKQLPPTILNLEAKELERTLFEILIERYPFKSEMLDTQYRARREIADFPSMTFYGGRVKTHENAEKISISDLNPSARSAAERFLASYPLIFIDTEKSGGERTKKGSKSYHNPVEAKIVERVVRKLERMGIDRDCIGVISPYDDQVRLIRDLVDCEVKSVDGYQGREKEVIIISFVRSNEKGDLGFLRDYRRLNVALTRAKRLLIAVGSAETLSKDVVYRRFIGYVKERGAVIGASTFLSLD
ncbi:IGHMBP2 family helicase [Geoglobus acetivorans]|uniref:DNA helicase, UvrD/REP family n=1 Tax=Geoglobus acetivorans TaxID=565033 RepID=A0A0A7GHF5_GEOAI|nr:DNA helicase, UvrD/REP family [Geoglobus acetivorans]